ncbi:hypothetical protein [Schlesneria paludicola]|uniref:hypothetical protein n=1 Tax=Schlesneria paludicola TaxID=360056 RepID=UPI00029A6783|nr:hypothetical protein [Schlesneria paludicola]
MFVAFPLVISLLVGIATWILAVPTIGRELAPGSPHEIGFAIGLLTSVSIFCLSTLRTPHSVVPTTRLLTCSTICVVASLALQAYGNSLASSQAVQILDALRDRANTNRVAATADANFNVSARIPQSVASAAYLSEFFGIWLGAVGVCAAMTSSAFAPVRFSANPPQGEVQAVGV